jgi:LacI family transcriptional regulator
VLHTESAHAGYRTVILTERTHAPLERRVADLVNGAAVDGLVYVSATLGMPLPGNGAGRIPVVLVNRYLDGDTADTVVSDNSAGGRAVAEAMLDLGHRRIALISGPENATTSRDRERGFRDGLEARGVDLDEALRRVGQFSHHSGYQWGLDLLTSRPRPTAIFAVNDLIAFGALDAARRMGIRVPDELSVVGFDDIEMAGWEAFNLTTVKQPLAKLGREAVALLLDRIAAAGDSAPRRRTFPVDLVRRRTLAAAPT